MKINGKKGIFLALSSVLLIATAACSSGGGNSGGQSTEGTAATAGSDATAKTIELRMTWWGSQTRHDLTTKMIALFEEKHPNIKIKPEYSGWDGYFDKLSTQVAGSNAPDIIQMDYAFLSDYAKRGTLLDLGPYTEDGTLRTEQHESSMLEAGSIDGKLYAITLGLNAAGVIYNASVLQELGIAEPEESWTWTDFADLSNQIAEKKGEGYYGTPDISGTTNMFEFFVRQNGTGLFADKALGPSQEVTMNWFNYWKDLRESGGATTPEITAAMTNALETRPLSVGQSAFDFAWSNQLLTYINVQKNQSDKLKMQVIPHSENEKQIGEYLKPGQFISGNAKTKHPKEVAMLIDFMVNDPDATAILGSERGVPVNSGIREQLKSNLTESEQLVFDFIDLVSQHSSNIDPPYPQGFSEIDKNFKSASEQIAFGQGSIEQVTEQFISGANQILSKTQ
ncbi:ABC transporter substrate-binding protein [Paenibacillus camerounensis]|uniref:ABC transporter substrate-binding protein n=1 Tax=Paenibacillus camerounensis TaxID=1243663 RepID=UPI0005A88206|nr:ABC transporter substrate-binding protein [Paenibacillus camerounensis]